MATLSLRGRGTGGGGTGLALARLHQMATRPQPAGLDLRPWRAASGWLPLPLAPPPPPPTLPPSLEAHAHVAGALRALRPRQVHKRDAAQPLLPRPLLRLLPAAAAALGGLRLQALLVQRDLRGCGQGGAGGAGASSRAGKPMQMQQPGTWASPDKRPPTNPPTHREDGVGARGGVVEGRLAALALAGAAPQQRQRLVGAAHLHLCNEAGLEAKSQHGVSAVTADPPAAFC